MKGTAGKPKKIRKRSVHKTCPNCGQPFLCHDEIACLSVQTDQFSRARVRFEELRIQQELTAFCRTLKLQPDGKALRTAATLLREGHYRATGTSWLKP